MKHISPKMTPFLQPLHVCGGPKGVCKRILRHQCQEWFENGPKEYTPKDNRRWISYWVISETVSGSSRVKIVKQSFELCGFTVLAASQPVLHGFTALTASQPVLHGFTALASQPVLHGFTALAASQPVLHGFTALAASQPVLHGFTALTASQSVLHGFTASISTCSLPQCTLHGILGYEGLGFDESHNDLHVAGISVWFDSLICSVI